jgi:hypothetical protein
MEMREKGRFLSDFSQFPIVKISAIVNIRNINRVLESLISIAS